MTLLYYSPMFLEHDPGSHPERPERLVAIWNQLQRGGLIEQCQRPEWTPVSSEALARVHGLPYAAQLKLLAEQGGGRIETDTVISRASYEVALLAAGAACDATRRVLRGEDRQALCLSRPPGHHALADAPMGFCLFNNVALAARTALAEFGLQRVLIVDFDVHHGNGTQDLFWEDPQVGFLSIHRWAFYPGTGSAEEVGAGPGRGYTLNLPVTMGTSRQDYHDLFVAGLEKFAAKLRPELVLISAGFDAHREDPVGSLGLETEDFERLTTRILDVADSFAAGKVVSLLEGGYHVQRLAEGVELHLRTLLARQQASARPSN